MGTQPNRHNKLIKDLYLFLGPWEWGGSMEINTVRYTWEELNELYKLLDSYVNGLITLKRKRRK